MGFRNADIKISYRQSTLILWTSLLINSFDEGTQKETHNTLVEKNEYSLLISWTDISFYTVCISIYS